MLPERRMGIFWECRAYGLSTKANVVGEGTTKQLFIEAYDCVSFADSVNAMDTTHTLQAKAVFLTSQVKELPCKNCLLP